MILGLNVVYKATGMYDVSVKTVSTRTDTKNTYVSREPDALKMNRLGNELPSKRNAMSTVWTDREHCMAKGGLCAKSSLSCKYKSSKVQ